MNIVSFFVGYFSFTAEIVAASLFFAHFFERKKLWWFPMALGIGAMCLVSYFWNPGFDKEGVLSLTFKYVVFYVVVIAMLHFSFQCGIWGAVFCGTMGYCVQHITYNIFFIATRIASVPAFNDFEVDVLHLLYFCTVYVILIHIVRWRYAENKEIMHRKFMKNWGVIVFGAIFVTAATFLDNISRFLVNSSGVGQLNYLVDIYLIIISICIVYILLSIVRERKAQEEFKSMKLLLHSQRKVYHNSKEMIDSVNLKAHDLKHQLHTLGGSIPKKQADEMELLVNMYDASLHTGSEALDIVLAEKGVHCVNRGILLTCLLDGGHIKGFSDTDIFSFFGNAIDNAIEAVDPLPEEKRIISITESVQANLVNIRIENYCGSEQISFEDGLPVTKRDIRYHGFGTKSMKHISEKYGGNIFFSQEEEKFVVNLILPVPRLEH